MEGNGVGVAVHQQGGRGKEKWDSEGDVLKLL